MAEVDWSSLREDALGDFVIAELPANLQLPALPHAVTLFIQKSNNPDVALKDLAKIVETDTGLTLELLRYVNSTFVGLRSKAKGVLQALTLLGQRQSKMFIISTGMQAAVRAKKSKLINQSCFWNASLQKALFAKEVASLLKTDGDTAFAGALLQDYLLPILTNDLFDNYLQFVENRKDHACDIGTFEQKHFGWDHALAAACLAHRWQLPDDLVCCILFHHRGLRILTDPQLGRSPAAAVAISALLPDQLRQCYNGLEQLLLLESKWPAFRLEELAERVDTLHLEMGLGVRNDFPLARRCRPALAGGTDQVVDGTLKASCVG